MKQILFFILASFLFVGAVNRVAAQEITPANPPPGNAVAPADPGQLVANFYQFALMIGGILAFGAIVYGGIKYTVEAGNPSGKSEGKEWITQALLGLLLLLGAYIILNTINPNLTNLSLPSLTPIQAPTSTAADRYSLTNENCGGKKCDANTMCRAGAKGGLPACVPVITSPPPAPPHETPCGSITCTPQQRCVRGGTKGGPPDQCVAI